MRNSVAVSLFLWAMALRQWIIGSRRFEGTKCPHLQRSRRYESMNMKHYVSSTCRNTLTHWQQNILEELNTLCYPQMFDITVHR